MILLYFLTYKSRFPRQLLMTTIIFSLIDIYKNQTLTEKKKEIEQKEREMVYSFLFLSLLQALQNFFLHC